mmetsp:Transcript_7349/g.18432  ORF Transcript_7349/g.18432 Transcript_7349/m.18432 type:complete len:217 (-) Transcript_7349:452-1102(-)
MSPKCSPVPSSTSGTTSPITLEESSKLLRSPSLDKLSSSSASLWAFMKPNLSNKRAVKTSSPSSIVPTGGLSSTLSSSGSFSTRTGNSTPRSHNCLRKEYSSIVARSLLASSLVMSFSDSALLFIFSISFWRSWSLDLCSFAAWSSLLIELDSFFTSPNSPLSASLCALMSPIWILTSWRTLSSSLVRRSLRAVRSPRLLPTRPRNSSIRKSLSMA